MAKSKKKSNGKAAGKMAGKMPVKRERFTKPVLVKTSSQENLGVFGFGGGGSIYDSGCPTSY